MYERLLADRIERFEKKSVLVLGPRQVGKSTLLRSMSPDIAIDLSSPEAYRRYVGHPERLERELRAGSGSRKTVLID